MASAGPFKGTGMWKLARKRFEGRMWQAGYKSYHAAPTFEWYDGFPQGKPMTDHLKELCDKVVPHFPGLGGDNSVLWLISKMPPMKPLPMPRHPNA